MLFCRISNILRPSQTLFKKLICANEIRKCEHNGTPNSCFETPDILRKRPKNPFLRFVSSKLPELTAKYPEASFEEKRNMIRNLWKSMDGLERKPYNDAFLEETDEYKFAQLLHECQMQDTPKIKEKPIEISGKEKRKLKKEKKLSGAPSKPLTPFTAFMKSKRGTCPKAPIAGFIGNLIEEYRNLSPDEKKKFEEESEKSQQEYRKKMIEWEERMFKAGRTDLFHKPFKFEKKN